MQKKLQWHLVDTHSYEVQLIKTLALPLFSGDLDRNIHIDFIDTRKVCSKFWAALKLRTVQVLVLVSKHNCQYSQWLPLANAPSAQTSSRYRLWRATVSMSALSAYRTLSASHQKDFITPTLKQMNHLKEDSWWLPMIAASSRREPASSLATTWSCAFSWSSSGKLNAWLIQCNGYVILVNVNNSITKKKVSLSCTQWFRNQSYLMSEETSNPVSHRIVQHQTGVVALCLKFWAQKEWWFLRSFGSSEIFTVLNVGMFVLCLGPNPDSAPLRQTNWDCSKKCRSVPSSAPSNGENVKLGGKHLGKLCVTCRKAQIAVFL